MQTLSWAKENKEVAAQDAQYEQTQAKVRELSALLDRAVGWNKDFLAAVQKELDDAKAKLAQPGGSPKKPAVKKPTVKKPTVKKAPAKKTPAK